MKIYLKRIKFAWKNIWRNRRRSGATMGVTAMGVTGLLFFGGFALYTYESLEEFSARQQGHVVLSHANFYAQNEEKPMQHGVEDWEKIRADLKSNTDVRQVLPRIEFTGLIANGDKSSIFVGSGVDACYEFTVTGPFLEVTQGEVLNPDSDMPTIMLGKGLAQQFGTHIGDSLTLLTTTVDGTLNGVDAKVVGIFGTGVPEMDQRKLYVSLNVAQNLIATRRVSTLSVYLKNTALTMAYVDKLKQRYPQLATRSWDELATFYHGVRNLYDRIFAVMGFVIVIVVLLSIINTIGMTVVERTREIGTLAALGALPGELLFNFVIEAAMIGVIGSAIGMLVAGGITLSLFYGNVMMPPPPGMTQGYPLRIAFSSALYAKTALAMLAITIVGAYFAARKGVRKPIVEALAHV